MTPLAQPRRAERPAQDVAEARLAHEVCHADWKRHTRYCLTCFRGDRCIAAETLAGRADDAGKRWRLAEERAAQGAGRS